MKQVGKWLHKNTRRKGRRREGKGREARRIGERFMRCERKLELEKDTRDPGQKREGSEEKNYTAALRDQIYRGNCSPLINLYCA